MERVSTRTQRERDLADVRQRLTILAACAGIWARASVKSIFVGVVALIIAPVVLESLGSWRSGRSKRRRNGA